jgi:hypothetical protein
LKDQALVERLLVASLRKALEETAPEQIEVFDTWFDPADRRPHFHIAPVIGAISYLRRDDCLYKTVMEKGGWYASDWSYQRLSQVERKLWESLPRFGRERAVRRLLRTGVRNIQRDAELETQCEREKLLVTVSNSLFCRTSSGNGPLCLYYASLFAGVLAHVALGWSVVVESSCQGQGRPVCQFETSP